MSEEMQKLPLTQKIGYGFGDLASCLFWSTISTYLLYFYTDVFGLTAAAAGLMFFVSRFSDAIFDVVMGMLADRTKSRWGRFRPYLLWLAIPMGVGAILAFTTPSFGGAGKIIYAYITYILFMFLYSAINIPYTALLGVISSDPAERSDAATSKFIGAYLGGIIVSATALPLATHYLGHGNEARGWQLTLTVYSIAAALFFFITFLSTRERVQPIATEKVAVKDDLGDLVHNGPWIALFAVTILLILFVCIRSSITTHYFKYYVGTQEVNLFGKMHHFGFAELTSAFNTVGQIASLVGTAMVPLVTRIIGRKRATLLLFITALICTGAYYFLRPQDLILIFGLNIIGSLVGGPISALLWIMYADTADYSEWKTGRRATGLVFSASIMSNKMGWAVGSMIAAWILGTTGFVPNVVQTPAVLNGLKGMMSLISVVPGVIAVIVLAFFYRLDEKTMADVKAELDERRKAGGAGAPAVAALA
ncbi:MAG TPA: MFS transporter [Tepidisphaeraceae bacterium]|jgi:GPH family glycoside/pentoside/hexuronide:cation symporter